MIREERQILRVFGNFDHGGANAGVHLRVGRLQQVHDQFQATDNGAHLFSRVLQGREQVSGDGAATQTRHGKFR